LKKRWSEHLKKKPWKASAVWSGRRPTHRRLSLPLYHPNRTAVLSKEFTSQVVLSVQNKTGLGITDTDQIGAIVAAYNELSAGPYSQCDLSCRWILSIELNTDFASRNLESTTGRQKVQEDSGDILIFAVVGICKDCSTEPDLLDVVFSADLLSRVIDAISTVLGTGQLLGIREVDLLDCSGSIEDFTKTVVVDLVFLCLDDLPAEDPRLQAIANAFVSTYNRVVSNYCDPLFRMLTDTEVISTGEVTEESKLTLERTVNRYPMLFSKLEVPPQSFHESVGISLMSEECKL
jgi:hypothetical protein